MKLYENSVEGMITDDEYFYMREKYSDKIEETMEILRHIEEEKTWHFQKRKQIWRGWILLRKTGM